MPEKSPPASTAAVVIGRNEGARLVACLRSLLGQVEQIVYVDSGSSDNSLTNARSLGVHVVELSLDAPFTAARARNAGISCLGVDETTYVQFIDGDCTLRSGWLEAARTFLETQPDFAVVCGRRRERYPEASVYNSLCDREWDTPVGPALACGGDALMRLEALNQVGGFRSDMIAGEEPELCVRLRAKGWKIMRHDAEMTWHDAAMTRFSQWWARSRRAGHAFAEGSSLHGAPPERHWVRETRRALVWGLMLPLIAIVGSLFWPPLIALLLAFPLQVLRLALRSKESGDASWSWAFFTTISKVPEALGALEFYWNSVRKKPSTLIEHKRS